MFTEAGDRIALGAMTMQARCWEAKCSGMGSTGEVIVVNKQRVGAQVARSGAIVQKHIEPHQSPGKAPQYRASAS